MVSNWFKQAQESSKIYDVKVYRHPDDKITVSGKYKDFDGIERIFVHTGKTGYVKKLLADRFGKEVLSYL